MEASGEIPIAAGVEIFAHELAHVATPEDREHGEAWKTAFDRILEEYNRIAQDLFGEGGEEPGGTSGSRPHTIPRLQKRRRGFPLRLKN